MSAKRLYRWYAHRFEATTRRPARAMVILHAHEIRFGRRYTSSEQWTVPLPPPTIHVTNEQLVAQAIRQTGVRWDTSAFPGVRKAMRQPFPAQMVQAFMAPADDEDLQQLPQTAIEQMRNATYSPHPSSALGASAGTLWVPIGPAPHSPHGPYAPRNYGLDDLTPLARRMHSPTYALGGVAVNALLIVLTFMTSYPLLLIGFALLIIDARNLMTLHGWLRWSEWWQRSAGWTVLVLLFAYPALLLLPIAYCIQCYGFAGRVKQAEHERLTATIAQLERELSQPIGQQTTSQE